MYRVKYLILLLSIVFTANAIAASKGVAKVIKARGKVYELASKKKLKKGDWIKEGAKILTKNRSFIKLLFIDKSKMSLGPNSKMVVTKFPKKKAGIISLMKGQLRSQVTKNYMEMSDKEKSKLFIRTKTAAMGVRGTDFQVNYNPKNQNTSLVTFEGAVAMGAIGDIRRGLNQARLERIVSSPTAVMVTRGQFSGVMPNVDTKPLAPIKINKKQLKAMEKNDGSVSKRNTPKKKKPKKLAKRNILPPGISSSEFAGTSKKDLAKEFEKVDLATANIIKNEADEAKENPNPEPSNNPVENTSLKEGGLIDTSNVLYIPPPQDAAIDPVTKEYIIPGQLGSFDSSTGEYQNDYFELKSTGEFVAKDVKQADGRAPASSDLPPPPPKNVVQQIQEHANYDPSLGYNDPETGADGTLVDDVLENRDDQILEQQENLLQQRTKVRFIFNNTP